MLCQCTAIKNMLFCNGKEKCMSDTNQFPFTSHDLQVILNHQRRPRPKAKGLSQQTTVFCSVLLTLKFIPFTLLKNGLFNFIMYSHPYNDSVPCLVHLFTKPTFLVTKPTFLEGYTWMLGLDILINSHCPVLTLSQYCVIN